MAVFERFAN